MSVPEIKLLSENELPNFSPNLDTLIEIMHRNIKIINTTFM